MPLEDFYQYLGDPWTIDLEVNNESGEDLPSSGIALSMHSIDGTFSKVFDETNGLDLQNLAQGMATANIQPDEQVGFSAPNYYAYQLTATPVNGLPAVQKQGFFATRVKW